MVWVIMAATGTGKDSIRKFFSLILSELKNTHLKVNDAEVIFSPPEDDLAFSYR